MEKLGASECEELRSATWDACKALGAVSMAVEIFAEPDTHGLAVGIVDEDARPRILGQYPERLHENLRIEVIGRTRPL